MGTRSVPVTDPPAGARKRIPRTAIRAMTSQVLQRNGAVPVNEAPRDSHVGRHALAMRLVEGV
jgi:hypothetical protein